MKIGLCMIVKNEAHIIHESLGCTLPLIDTYCIVDTGSTDDTIQKIKDFYADKGIYGEVHQREWKNFGHNRSEALKLCDGKMDYILVIDADDLMGFPENGKEQLHSILEKEKPNGVRLLIKQNTIEYMRGQIFKANDDWKYVGVLHEYPTNGKSDCKQITLPREFWMESRRLGGRNKEGNKLQRDIEVLTKGLEDEPDNDRYVFYLAQSYRDAGNFAEALKYYKKRFKMGRWHEEAWYAAYRVGECYKTLGNIPKFEYWMQKAYEFRRWRAEPLYQLTEYFRVHGQLHKAYHYMELGRKIEYPKDDVLFVEKFPHEGGFDYEASILDFYVHNDKKIGLRDSIKYLLKRGDHIQNVVSNLKFYIQPILSNVKPLNISNPFGPEFRYSAISVLEYPYANARFVNYEIQPNGSYKTPQGIVITRNAYINLDTGESVAMGDPIPIFESEIRGIEDLRLYTHNGNTYFTATSYKQYIKDHISIVHGEYNLQSKRLEHVKGIPSPFGQQCEKNWVHIPDSGHQFIYSWSPLRIGEIRGDKLEIIKTINTPPLFSIFRGSAPPMKHNNKWICLVHFVEYCTPRKYYHCFVEFDMDWTVLKVSLPFYFRENRIEYCISTRIVGNTIECYPSLNDSDTAKVIFDMTALSWIIISEPVIKNNIVRVPTNTRAYWDGGYSRCLAGSSIEQYINESINKQNLNTSVIFSCFDGVLGNSEYTRQYECVGRKIANISENEYSLLKQHATKNTVPIVAGLCSRQLSGDMLLTPLDDDTFKFGLDVVLKNVTFPNWDDRRPVVFWRGGSSGYDRPSIRMKVVDILYETEYADVRLTKWGNWENEKDIPENHFGDRCDISKHVQNKYILIIDGNCIASNHQWVFGSGSVPIMITHPDNEYWFKKFLKPMENYVPISYDLSDLKEKIEWLISNDTEARKIAENAARFSRVIFSPEFQRKYIDDEILRLFSLHDAADVIKMDWIENIVSAWKGHRKFAEWITSQYKDPEIVELGVDYGYSSFVFANSLKNTNGKVYGIDLFAGDVHAGFRNTYEGVMKNIKNNNLSNIDIIMGDFTHVSKLWSKQLDILHIDGLHTYDAVKNDFTCWSKFVKEDGIILFHDTAIPQFGIKDFFRELSGGYRLYFTHSAGLGIYTKNEKLYRLILNTFDNVYDFSIKPF